MNAPDITINGVQLTIGQALTVQIAVISFHMTMHNPGLGEDEIGKLATDAYLTRLGELIKLMVITK